MVCKQRREIRPREVESTQDNAWSRQDLHQVDLVPQLLLRCVYLSLSLSSMSIKLLTRNIQTLSSCVYNDAPDIPRTTYPSGT